MKIKTSLLPYQEEGVKKLLPLRVGALYMEMGTGKTRTALEIIAKRLEKKKIDKVLWLCPCSVKANIKADLEKHSEGWEQVIRIAGIESLSQSDRLYLKLMKYVNPKTMVIVDESNLVKNFFAKRTKRITEIGKVARYRMILNGTPVSKNQADLYAQWYFLDHRIFGYRTFWSFAANHLEYDDNGRVRRVLNVGYLSSKIAPYSYVKKKDEALDLPDKNIRRFYFMINDSQRDHYNHIADEMLLQVDEANESTIYRTFTALQLVTSGREITSTKKPLQSKGFFENAEDNPRIEALIQNLNEEKTIIWVKFQHEADEITQVLPDGSYEIFMGKTPLKKRVKGLERFEKDEECIYLIANKVCGGYGLNLQFCHRMIYYNNDWDFATRAQSEDRVHRIGQAHDVDIIDLVSTAKIDQRIIDCLDKKERLSEAFKSELRNGRGKEFIA